MTAAALSTLIQDHLPARGGIIALFVFRELQSYQSHL
jgi:hypothetical protein